jgi:hypothetical protein
MPDFWWNDLPHERYWLSVFWMGSIQGLQLPSAITSVTHFGERKRPWSWQLISNVRQGDTVFTWVWDSESWDRFSHDGQVGGFFGFSTACAEPTEYLDEIDPDYVDARFANQSRLIKCCDVSLSDHHVFQEPMVIDEVRRHSHILRENSELIRSQFKSPAFGPWSFSDWREMGIVDGAVFKLPAADVSALGLLDRPHFKLAADSSQA